MMQSPSKPTEPSQQTEEFIRREPAYLNETGLDAGFVANLALKALYYRAHPSTTDLSETLALSIPVIQEVMTLLTRDGLAETIPGEGQGPASYRYSLTSSGMVHAAAALERNAYVGPAPVPFDEYIAQVRRQSAGGSGYSRTVVSEALAQLVLSRDTLDRVGRAIYSGRPTLIHGHSGNGKTTIASLLGQAMAGDILIPHAVEVYGHIVRVFDPSKHRPANGAAGGDGPTSRRWDRRWAIVKRPAIMAGGELTRHSLELVLDQRSKVYEAPLQLKANGGILIIDDFGRQQIPAAELLNRWIVALEGGVDHLSLHTGQTIAVPFDVIPFFSTNLPPEHLADEAFLRRIRYKVEIPNPSPEEFRTIFRQVCREQGVEGGESTVDYLLERWYEPQGRERRGCHPRDLIEAVVDAARFNGAEARVTPETLDEVCHTYFLSE